MCATGFLKALSLSKKPAVIEEQDGNLRSPPTGDWLKTSY
jgi:hypothetical protein